MELKREKQAKMIDTLEKLSEAEASGVDYPNVIDKSYPDDITITDFIDQLCEQYEKILEKSNIIGALNRGANRANVGNMD